LIGPLRRFGGSRGKGASRGDLERYCRLQPLSGCRRGRHPGGPCWTAATPMVVRSHRCRLTDPGRFDILRRFSTAGEPQHEDGADFAIANSADMAIKVSSRSGRIHDWR
jgi:hypothetical protein